MASVHRHEKTRKAKAMSVSEYETYGAKAAPEPIRIPVVRVCSVEHCGKPCCEHSLQCRECREDAIRHELRETLGNAVDISTTQQQDSIQ